MSEAVGVASQRPAAEASFQAPDMRDYLVVWRTRWYWVALGVIAGVVLGSVAALAGPTEYEATTTVLLRSLSTDPIEQLQDRQSINTFTEREFALSEEVAEQAAQSLDVERPRVLLRGLAVRAADESAVLRFDYTHTDPETAAERSQAFAIAYVAARNRRASDAVAQVQSSIEDQLVQIAGEIETLTNRLNRLRADTNANGVPDGDPDLIEDLETQVSVLRSRRGLLEGQQAELLTSSVNAGEVLTAAVPPSSPSGLPNWLLVAMGTIAGTMGGLMLALVMHRASGLIASGDAAQVTMGVPAIGHVPDARPHRPLRLSLEEIAGPVQRATATVMSVREDLKVLVLVPVGDASGPHQIGPSVAASLRRFAPTVLIDATGRREVSETELRVEAPRTAPASQAQRIRSATQLPEWVEQRGGAHADLVRVTPGALSGPTSAVKALRGVDAHYDFVVVAAGPLDQSSAALDLASAPGASVVPVVRLGKDDRDEARRTIRDLTLAAADIPGLIAIGPRRAWATREVLPVAGRSATSATTPAPAAAPTPAAPAAQVVPATAD